MNDILAAAILTLNLAAVTTILLLFIGTPIAWWLARTKHRAREWVAAAVALPLVLPPTVIGFYVLLALGPNGPGGWLGSFFGIRTFAFSFAGLVIGSLFYSLPFMVQPLRAAFEAVGDDTLEVARTLGAKPFQVFARVAVPSSRAGFISGMILTFAHTIGEFGVVLMVGGSVPGETRVLSIAIYQFVERLEWDKAHLLSAALVIVSLLAMASTLMVEGRMRRIGP